MKFEDYLKTVSKKSGDELLPSTIERYSDVIKKYQKEIVIAKNFKELIDIFNKKIKLSRNNITSSAFSYFIRYQGGEIKKSYISYRGKKYSSLESSNKSANMKSKRFLQKKVLSRGELKELIIGHKNLQAAFYSSFLYDTACRREEFVGSEKNPNREIKKCDIRILNVPKGNIYGEVDLLGKGEKRRRVYLTKTTVLLMKIWVKRNNIKEKDDIAYLRKKNGEKYKKPDHELYKIIKEHAENVLNRDNIHPHCFRHTKGTHLADAGATAMEIQKYFGHDDIKTSMIYIDISTYIGERGFNNNTIDIMES